MPRHKSRAWLALKVTLRTTLQTPAFTSCDGQQGKGHVERCNVSHVALQSKVWALCDRHWRGAKGPPLINTPNPHTLTFPTDDAGGVGQLSSSMQPQCLRLPPRAAGVDAGDAGRGAHRGSRVGITVVLLWDAELSIHPTLRMGNGIRMTAAECGTHHSHNCKSDSCG